ncbi:MAG: hypothetical protein ACJ79S_15005 [Gemmatimonadaceae bacterium]
MPPASRRRAARVARALLRHLGLALLVLVFLGGAAAGSVAWAIRNGMLTVAAGNPRSASARLAERRSDRTAGRSAATDALRLACAAAPRSADEVQRVIQTLADGRAAGVPSDAGRSVTVLAVSGDLADRFPAAASMTMVAGRGLLTWNMESPGNGSTVYHELVHLTQFRLDAEGQRRLVERLRRAEPASGGPTQIGFTERDALDAWKSMHTILAYGRDPEEAESLYRAVVAESKSLRRSMPTAPVARMVKAAEHVIADSSWVSAQKRLALVSWLHQGAPPTSPPKGWGWRDELQRLAYFEAMAYAADRRCRTEGLRN